MPTLTELLVEECGKCEPVAAAWVAANDIAFAVQTHVWIKTRKGEKDFTYYIPTRVKTADWRLAEAMVAKVKRLFPRADCSLVSYRFYPGGSFVEVFRQERKTKKDQEEEDV